jgi:PTS system galactitol-specific IIA component
VTLLADLILPEALCPSLEAASASAAIEFLADRLLALGKVRPSFAQAVIAREATMPTGLPLATLNVAIPHTDPEHVLAPAVAVGTLRFPVTFASMDDPDEKLPVRIIFLLALNDRHRQLELLQYIAGMIQEEPRLRQLLAASDADAMSAVLR